jgi:hypothetical protein
MTSHFNFNGANQLTYKQILDHYGELEVFRVALGYVPELFSKRYLSPFRPEDKSPGCRFIERSGFSYRYWLIDNAGYKGRLYWDCFSTLIELKNLKSIKDACSYFMKNAPKKNLNTVVGVKLKKKPFSVYRPRIVIHADAWVDQNNVFDKWGIGIDALKENSIYKTTAYFTDTRTNSQLLRNRFGNPLTETVVAYKFHDSGNTKLHFMDNRQFRFYSNCTNNDIWGLKDALMVDIEKKGDLLVITKSCKDYLVLKYLMGYNCIGLQNEGCLIPENILKKLKAKYKTIVLFFDNDEGGIKASIRLSKKYDIFNICIPNTYTATDPCELIEHVGQRGAREIIYNEFYKKKF